LGLKLSYDPTIPILGIYPEETIIEKDTCTPMFSAALFTIARTWKQPRCPSNLDEWIKKLWYIYTMEYYLVIKRNTFESVLMRWMNLELILLREVSQREKQLSFLTHIFGFPSGSDGKESAFGTGDLGPFYFWAKKIPWRRKW
uniref:Uncharacterized protein n=1 Tax=Moschus moschiferus TaxID=68415 RepID=A0A8C6D107_MOSMO